jgi:hypothetical protein
VFTWRDRVLAEADHLEMQQILSGIDFDEGEAFRI